MAQSSDKMVRAARVRRQKLAKPTSKTGRETKKAKCLELLARRQGASVEELQDAVRWQAHSVRGVLSGTVRKLDGYRLDAITADGKPRRYKVTKPASRA